MKVGSEPRFEQLYWRSRIDLLAFIRRRVPLDAVEDVLAETYIVAWRRLDDIPADAEKGWLFGVARNVIRNTVRAQARQRALTVRVADGARRPEPQGGFDDAIASRAELAQAWNELSDNEQEVIALVAWDDLSHKDAALVLGVTTSAFAVRLYRARRRLLHLLERGVGR